MGRSIPDFLVFTWLVGLYINMLLPQANVSLCDTTFVTRWQLRPHRVLFTCCIILQQNLCRWTSYPPFCPNNAPPVQCNVHTASAPMDTYILLYTYNMLTETSTYKQHCCVHSLFLSSYFLNFLP